MILGLPYFSISFSTEANDLVMEFYLRGSSSNLSEASLRMACGTALVIGGIFIQNTQSSVLLRSVSSAWRERV